MKNLLFLVLCFLETSFAGVSAVEFQHLADSLAPGARLGLSVRSVRTGQELVDIRADDFFTPASTLKTLTTAAALSLLPLDYAPETSLHLEGSLSGKTFTGFVRVKGQGDPNISGRFYSSPFFLLYAMADSLKAMGIDTLRGKIIADTSFYKGPRKPEHWRKNYFNSWYGAEVAPLAFNDNCVLVTLKPGANVKDTAIISVDPEVGYVQIKNELLTSEGKSRKWKYAMDSENPIITFSGQIGAKVDFATLVLPVRNPNAYFIAALCKAFQDKGLIVIDDANVHRGIEIFDTHISAAPLLSILDEINQRSQNLHAEMLFRNMGNIIGKEGSVSGGLRAENQFLKSVGVSPSDFQVFDGCGLSPSNKVKPATITQMLAFMAKSKRISYYMQSFAAPQIGSAAKRMSNIKIPWRTCFKTGYIAETHALVGYVLTIDGDTLAVALYLNETGKISDHKSKNLIDTLWSRIVYATNDGFESLLAMKGLWIQGMSVQGYPQRILYFSKQLLGHPYLLGPTGESYLDTLDQKPLVNLDSMDCVTYIEHVLALAQSPHEDSLFKELQRIRYFGGKIGYKNRKHYFVEDWIGEGKYAKIIPLPGDTTIVRTLPKNEFFASKNLTYGKPDPKTYVRYLPYEKALEWAQIEWKGENTIRGIGFVGNSEKIDVTHTGFLILNKGEKPLLRDASQIAMKVTEHPLDEYLKSRKGKTPGIVSFEFIP